MQLIALVNSGDHVCCRYRVAAFRDWLELQGHSLQLVPLPRSWPRRWLLFRRLRGANVLLQRQLLPTWQLAHLRANVARLLFDFDDAVFLRDSYASEGLHHPRKLRRFVATMRSCDAIIAGNRFLAEHAAMYADAERIFVIPTCVDEMRYAIEPKESDGKELVWIGSSSTLQGIERIVPMLEEIGRRIPGLRLKIICDRFPALQHVRVVRVPWNEECEARELASSDVGISWIPDDLWSRGKCGLKLLQYLAAGLPVVTNPIGVHPEIIVPGETGWLADTTDEWYQAVKRLIDDPSLRQRMGRAGRRLVESRYSVSIGSKLWSRLLSQLQQMPVLYEGGYA